MMKNLGHRSPPFAWSSIVEGLLARFAESPPLLGDGVGGHFGHIVSEVGSVVFEVAEEVVISVGEFAEEDGVIADLAIADGLEDSGPGGFVEFDVFADFFVLELEDAAVAFHGLGSFLIDLRD